MRRGEGAIPPFVWNARGMQVALARRDIGAVYRMLTKAGVSQRRISELTGQSQSEITEILQGRQVMSYVVLERIADGLGVARGWMGLAYAEDVSPATSTTKEVDEDMKRGRCQCCPVQLLQLGQIRLHTTPADPRTVELTSWLGADSAAVLASMNRPDAARSALASARDIWHAPNVEDQADMDWVTALVELNLGRLDVAEGLVATSVRHWNGTADRRQAVLGGITLATIHVQAGEPSGLELAHRAITDVAELRSVRARDRLVPLAAVLKARPGSAPRELAERAHHVAAAPVIA